MLAAAFDIVNDLISFDIVDHFCLHGGASNKRRAKRGGIATKHENFVKLDLIASFGCHQFNPQNVAALHFVLFATGFENREHGSFLLLTASCGLCF